MARHETIYSLSFKCVGFKKTAVFIQRNVLNILVNILCNVYYIYYDYFHISL